MVDIASEVYAAVHYAAGVVHMKLSAIEADFNKWTADNPEMKPLIDEGIQVGETMLKSRGVDPTKLKDAADEVLAVAQQVGAAIAVTAPPPNPTPLPVHMQEGVSAVDVTQGTTH